MNSLDEFRKRAAVGFCECCRSYTFVTQTPGSVRYCFVCANAPTTMHPDMRCTAMFLIDILKPPKKPRQPKGPKTMTRTR
jgi:hypothetical protein